MLYKTKKKIGKKMKMQHLITLIFVFIISFFFPQFEFYTVRLCGVAQKGRVEQSIEEGWLCGTFRIAYFELI